MEGMRSILILLAASACTKTPNKWDAFADELEDLRTKMCKCTTMACLERVDKELASWMPAEGKQDETKPAKTEARITRLTDELINCKRHVQGAEVKAAAALAELQAVKNQMCACTDVTCLLAVTDAFSRMPAFDQSFTPTNDENQRAAAITREMNACFDRISRGG